MVQSTQSTTQYVRCSNDLDPSFTSKSIRRSAAASSWAQLFTSTDSDRENDYPIIGLVKNLPETHGESFRNYVNNYMRYMLYGAYTVNFPLPTWDTELDDGKIDRYSARYLMDFDGHVSCRCSPKNQAITWRLRGASVVAAWSAMERHGDLEIFLSRNIGGFQCE